MQRTGKICLVSMVFLVGFAFGVSTVRLNIWLQSSLGRTFSPESPLDLWELRRFTYLAAPAIQALEDYRDGSGTYPLTIAELVFSPYPEYVEDMFYDPHASFHYHPSFRYSCRSNGNSFVIYMKMNLEDTLFYWSDDGRWTYRAKGDEWEVAHGVGP